MKKLSSRKSQVAVLITLLIAVIIVFAVFFINLAKISDMKLLTAQTSDKTALGMASQLASYTNLILQQVKPPHSLLQLIGIGCDPPPAIRCCDLNWGLLVPVITLLISIILFPFVPFLPVTMLATTLAFGSAPMIMKEISDIMRGGFSKADMSPYTAIKETGIADMLESIGGFYDPIYAYRRSGDIFEAKGPKLGTIQYDLTGSPIAGDIKSKNRIPRYAAWYWSKRYPLTSDAELIKALDKFVQRLRNYVNTDIWDGKNLRYTMVSFRVEGVNVTNTNNDEAPFVIDSDKVRIIRPIKAETGPIESFFDFLNSLIGAPPVDGNGKKLEGFLNEEFLDLSHRLFKNGYPVSYVKLGALSILPVGIPLPPFITFPFLNITQTYDDSEVLNVIENLRGTALRIMEVLNVPANARSLTVNNWLPAFKNNSSSTDSKDIYDRLQDSLDKIRVWRDDLASQNDSIKSAIENSAGITKYGLGDDRGECATACTYCSTECSCCDNYEMCSRTGIWCSGTNREEGRLPPACDKYYKDNLLDFIFGNSSGGDLYRDVPPGCPLQKIEAGCISGCACESGCDCKPVEFCDIDGECQACKFQGRYTKEEQGPTQLDQAIEILDKFIVIIENLLADINEVANAVDSHYKKANDYEHANGFYGWDDKDGNLHFTSVNVEGYPMYPDDFPYIVEQKQWLGFIKCKQFMGKEKGEVTTTVSRYDTDFKTVWWNVRYRNKPEQQEFSRDTLLQLIREVHERGYANVPASFSDYFITSKTTGMWEPDYSSMPMKIPKSNIKIKRVR